MNSFKSQEIQLKIASMTTDQEIANRDLKDSVENQNNKVLQLQNDLKASNEKIIKHKHDLSKLLE